MKLTVMEIKVLNAMRQNEYNDALQDYPCGTWSFTAIDNSGIKPKIARGVISSLVKKGLVSVTPQSGPEDPEVIGFTKEGVKLFDNADGNECTWEGPKLLKENDIDIPESTTTTNEKIYTIVEIAKELNIDPKKARKILRECNVEKEGKQWQWTTKEKYKEIKKLLSK